MSWLVYLQLHRQGGRLHARQLRQARHRSDLHRSARHHRHPRDLVGDHLLRGRRADGLAGGAHRHAAAPHDPRAGHRLVRHAAVPRRDRLGAARRAELRPAQPALSQRHRRSGGRAAVQHLFARRADLRHLLLHVPLRVRAGRERARPHSRRPRGRVLHSRRPHVGDGAARHHPACAARAARRRAGRVPAGDDAVRLARDPRAAGRLPHHDDEDLEPVPVSAEARARRRRLAAAAGADRAAAARRAHDPRPPRLRGGRRQAGRSAPRPARRVEMGRARRWRCSC